MKNSNKVLLTINKGDKVIYSYRGIYVEFTGKRRVLSTSVLNGGIEENLTGIFNYNCLADEYECSLAEKTYEEELKANGRTLGLNGGTITGISTAAWMEYVAIKEEVFEDLTVSAIVTGGVDKNAVRVGDPAAYYEKDGVFHIFNEEAKITPGTINILLNINQNLPAGVLTRALVTATEAKVTAVQELMLGSLYSTGIATGSGTDGTIIISDATAPSVLTDAGEHCKLGELIGKAVKGAVKEALFKLTGACPARQHKITERGKRFGITTGALWEFYVKYKEEYENKSGLYCASICQLEKVLINADSDSNLVVFVSLYLHLIDQFNWGLLQWGEVLRESKSLPKSLLKSSTLEKIQWVFKVNYDNDIETILLERLKGILVTVLLEKQ